MAKVDRNDPDLHKVSHIMTTDTGIKSNDMLCGMSYSTLLNSYYDFFGNGDITGSWHRKNGYELCKKCYERLPLQDLSKVELE